MRRLWTGALLAFLSLIITSAAPALAQTAVAVVADPDGVNLRVGPGTDYTSLTVVPKGAELAINGPTLNTVWLPVVYLGRVGFVDSEFVELRPAAAPFRAPAAQPLASPSPAGATPSPTPGTTPSPAPGGATPLPATMRVNTPDGVNLRGGPAMDQRVLAVIPNSTRLSVIARSLDGRWGQVSYNGLIGWVDLQFLAATDAATPTPSPTPSDAPAGRYIWPVAGRSITTPFSPAHRGIDIDQYPVGGNPVVSIAAGRVSYAAGNPCCSYGLMVKVQHPDGSESWYAHLQSYGVLEGQQVAQGQALGLSGNSGNSTGAHLHFEIHIGGVAVDPAGLLGRP